MMTPGSKRNFRTKRSSDNSSDHSCYCLFYVMTLAQRATVFASTTYIEYAALPFAFDICDLVMNGYVIAPILVGRIDPALVNEKWFASSMSKAHLDNAKNVIVK